MEYSERSWGVFENGGIGEFLHFSLRVSWAREIMEFKVAESKKLPLLKKMG